MQRLAIFKKAYFLLVCFLISIIVLTPTLIKDGFSIFSEEFLEGSIIFFLLIVGLVIDYFYKRETQKQGQALRDAWKHIGAVNLLVERFQTTFMENNEYPKSKKELQLFSAKMFEKIRGFIHCDYLLLRVIDTDTLNTVFEYSDSNNNGNGNKLNIKNNDLVSSKKLGSFDIITSPANAIGLMAFLIFSKTEIDNDRKMVIQKIISDFALIYIVSIYIL